jgi:protein SCO1/2
MLGKRGQKSIPADGEKQVHITMKIIILFLLTMLVGSVISCNRKSSESASTTVGKKYQLKGKVVSIDERGKMVNVDSEAIPGFMDAMTMPYQVKPENELEKLHPGDSITADLIVQDESAWLQNISVRGHSPVPASN